MPPVTTVLSGLSGLLLVAVLGEAPDPVGVWPLRPAPEVVEDFDPPDSTWGAGHRGVDLLGSVGQPVHAALPGQVTFAGLLAGRGVVVVEHGGTRTTYEPVSADVAVGDVVPSGARVGRLDLLGSHCYPRACLHWGWLRDDVYLDPLGLVGGGPVRLLPLAGLSPEAAGGVTGWATGGPVPWSPLAERWPVSGPRVGLLVGPPQPVGGDVGVELGGGQ